jgi:Carboxypeptidase regulatory-like domain
MTASPCLRNLFCLAALLGLCLFAAQAFSAQPRPQAGESHPSSGSQDNQNSKSDSQASPAAGSSSKDGQASPDSATTKLKIVVTNANDKPVANASVYVRFNSPGGFMHHDKQIELDLKTNQDGSAKIPDVPTGKILLQVVAKGWHTYGKWYDLQSGEQTIAIKLEAPPHWY